MKSNLTTLPEWLTRELFIGSDKEADEEADEEGDEDEENEDEDENSEENESDDESEEDGEDEEQESEEEDPLKGLKSALRTERKGHKAERRARVTAENENKQLRAQVEAHDGKENEAVASVQTELTSERAKNATLAGKIKDQAIHGAILAEATRQGYIDPEDALVIAKEIEADQDAEDPTDIDIDESSVQDAVERLAKRKKHLVGKAPAKKTSMTKSGTKSPRRKPTKKKDSVLSHYPSLS